MLTRKKLRGFNLEKRLEKESENKHNIHIERFPRKKLRPIWWTIIVFGLVLYLYFFLKKF